MSDYDPAFGGDESLAEDDDLAQVRELFGVASRPFLSSPWSWLAWAVLLPAAALATPGVGRVAGPPALLLFWSVVILIGGTIEMLVVRRRRRGAGGRSIARWTLRAQGNLSLVALALSLALGWRGMALAELLPGVWLLLLGHSFFILGGLAFRPLRTAGLLYQLGGLLALWPALPALPVFAATTGLGNLWMAVAISRARSASR